VLGVVVVDKRNIYMQQQKEQQGHAETKTSVVRIGTLHLSIKASTPPPFTP
jgi:uncharacterized protein YbaP (TraB family)